MRNVYAIGESLIDIIFSEGDVKAARPGGSMLNSAVSLGRSGKEIIFLSEFGNDQAGKFISDFLESNNVQTHHIHRYNDGKTPIALAFLNEKGNASYEFYKPYPKKRLQLDIPAFSKQDIFLFGSFFGIDPVIRQNLINIVQASRDKGALILYDPNFRKPHAHELEKLRPLILENIRLASIVKASDEDMEIIFGESDPEKLRRIAELRDKPMVITQGSKGALLSTPLFSTFAPARQIEVVSTIGAGDNFNAGLIYGLISQDVFHSTLETLSSNQWERILKFGVEFAANVCMHYDNYITREFAENLKV